MPLLIALRHPLGRFQFDFYDFAPRTLCLICILYSIRIRFQFVFVIHVYLPLPLPQPLLLPLPLPLRSPCGYASCRCCCPAGLLFSLLGRKWQLRQIESVAEQCHSNKADAVGQQAVEDDATNTPAIYIPPSLLLLLALISSKFDFHFNFQLKTSFAFVLRHYPI